MPLVLADGNTYSSAQGFKASARSKVINNEEPSNIDYIGFLDASIITFNDLRAGLYREAEVVYSLVDWLYPWAGVFETQTFWMVSTQFDGEIWKVSMEGVARHLKTKAGDLYGRTCRYQLGDTQCQFDIGSLTQSGRTVATVTDGLERQEFTSDATGVDDFYRYGKVTWVTGANKGLSSVVRVFTSSGGTIRFVLSSAYDIEAGDTFDIEPGCDKLVTTCDTKFTNVEFFGGFPFIPGSDRALRSQKSSN